MLKALFSNIVISLVLSLFLFPTNSLAGQATLAWDPPDIPTDVTGYMVHYGPVAGAYSEGVDVGNTTSYTISNLIDGQTYYFAVTAYSNNVACQSDFSNEVSISTIVSQYLLVISKPGMGQGTISGSGISCGDTCLAAYDRGAVVALAAVADPGSTFDGWSGGGCSGTGLCAVTMNANTTISATFNPNAVNYFITASANHGGVISPAGTSSVTSGRSLTYSIPPQIGYQIVKVVVDGNEIGAVNSFIFSQVDTNHSIAAFFRRIREAPLKKGQNPFYKNTYGINK